jgi:iron complex outermembrane receptor protein
MESSSAPPHLVLPFSIGNRAAAKAYGIEVSGNWRVTNSWTLGAEYTFLHLEMGTQTSGHLEMGGPESGSEPFKLSHGDSPSHQFHLTSDIRLPSNIELNTSLYYVDALPYQAVPSYLRADVRLTWRALGTLDVSIWGANLLDSRHLEFGPSEDRALATEVQRSIYGKVTWRF